MKESSSDIEKKAHFLEVINSFATQLLICKDVDEVLWLIARHAIAKMGYEDCVVYWINNETNLLEQRAAHGPKNPIEFDIAHPITIKIGKGICGSVALSGIPEIIPDTSKDDRYILDDEERLSEITVPIFIDGKVSGIIDSENSQKYFYTLVDLDILNTISSMCSSRISQILYKYEIAQHKKNLEEQVSKQTEELQLYIQELEQKNTELRQKEQEKEILLKEIHHRVKNNLQIVSSLLNLQSHYLNSEAEQNAFMDCQLRIVSMAAIHEQLYSKGDLSIIYMPQYVPDLINNLKRSYDFHQEIEIFAAVEDINLDIDTSVPIGLIITEIFTNSLKHAFPNKTGEIRLNMTKNDDNFILTISDNGIGFDLNATVNSLGMTIIETLSEQLNAEYIIQSNASGTTTKVIF